MNLMLTKTTINPAQNQKKDRRTKKIGPILASPTHSLVHHCNSGKVTTTQRQHKNGRAQLISSRFAIAREERKRNHTQRRAFVSLVSAANADCVFGKSGEEEARARTAGWRTTLRWGGRKQKTWLWRHRGSGTVWLRLKQGSTASLSGRLLCVERKRKWSGLVLRLRVLFAAACCSC